MFWLAQSPGEQASIAFGKELRLIATNVGHQVNLSIHDPEENNTSLEISELLASDSISEALEKFSELHTSCQAYVMGQIDDESRMKLLTCLVPSHLGLTPDLQRPTNLVELSSEMDLAKLSAVLDETSPDIAAHTLKGLPDQIAIKTIGNMRDPVEVGSLLDYAEDNAGGLMSSEFIALDSDMTVSEALEFVKHSARILNVEDLSYLLVADTNGLLQGGLSLSVLVAALPEERLWRLMYRDVISVSVDTDREDCARLMDRYNLLTLPVVNDMGKLVGIVRIEDMIYVLQEEATEDMYRMVGVGGEEKILGPVWQSVRSRLPWLCVNLGTAVFAGLVITVFQSTIAAVVALAIFLPVIAGQGGIVGTQTLTLIVRSMALGEISTAHAGRLLIKEIRLGMINGLVLGLLSGVIAMIWQGNWFLALVVGVAMMGNLVVAGISGVLVPLGLKSLRIDPALASAVAVTTVTDVVGFLIYLSLATATMSLIIQGF